MNDLTLSADDNSDSSSDNDVRNLSKPQIKSSCSISETNSVDLTRQSCGPPTGGLKLAGLSRKTPMKKQMSRLQMFQQKLLQSEGKYRQTLEREFDMLTQN